MISSKHNFIFIHIQKTAGNSIQTALRDFSDDQLVFRKSTGKVKNESGRDGLDVFNETLGFNDRRHKHATFQDYFDKLGDVISEYFVFSSVRNPFDRVISKSAFRKGPLSGPLRPDQLLFPDPLLRHLELNGEVAVENFIRFEQLKTDFQKICRTIGLPELELPHVNASHRTSYRDYYTDETKEIVANRYAEDIEYFGYTF